MNLLKREERIGFRNEHKEITPKKIIHPGHIGSFAFLYREVLPVLPL